MNKDNTKDKIKSMTEGGKKLAAIRDKLIKEVHVGTLPVGLDNLAKKLIKEAGGTPSFMTVRDYKWATCISVNDGVVHGVPGNAPFIEGDIVGLDVGLLHDGYHTDTSWSFIVGNEESEHRAKYQKFLDVGEETLNEAISKVVVGNKIGHISKTIQDKIEKHGYNVVKNLVGHGIGEKLHMPPQIPGVLKAEIKDTQELTNGMTVAIEVIYSEGGGEYVYANDDGWSLAMADGSIAGLFEDTVLISEKGPVVLTQS